MEKLINFYQIAENIGTAGQPAADQFSGIAKAGYSTVVNLAMHDSDNAIPEEGNIVTSLGMTYIHMPVPFDAPTVNHVRKFFGIMDALGNENVFVHCAVNARVSAFMHQYLTLRKGVASARASSPLLQKWLPEMDIRWRSIMELEASDIEV
jgi:protein tyrosine phosphatase (PTP) superfamily phosphohydrolase (DUF442 family)